MVKITERGWAGHYILSYRCRFRRNTLIEGKNDSVIVSTVGNLCSTNNEIEEIGNNRYYETVVFGTKKEGEYIEIDVCDEREFSSNSGIWAKTPKDLPDDVDNLANDMHQSVVEEMITRIS